MALLHDMHTDVFRKKGTSVCYLLCNAPKKKKKKETKNKMERKAGLMDGGVNYVIEQVEYNVV